MAKSKPKVSVEMSYAAISEVLRGIPREIQNRILATAVRSAARPVVRAAKKHAMKSKRTGALVASINVRVKEYKPRATAVAIIGPDRGRYGAGIKLKKSDDKRRSHIPAKYAHLVEFGHFSRAGTGVDVRTAKGTRTKAGTFKASSFILPQPFMRPAFAETKAQSERALIRGIGTGINRVRRRLTKEGSFKA